MEMLELVSGGETIGKVCCYGCFESKFVLFERKGNFRYSMSCTKKSIVVQGNFPKCPVELSILMCVVLVIKISLKFINFSHRDGHCIKNSILSEICKYCRRVISIW